MSGTVPWKILVGGFVPEPEHGNLEQLTALPGPYRFLGNLFAAIADVDVKANRRETARKVSKEDGLAEYRFVCGTDRIGYEQSETRVLESSDFPMRVSISTFGLPGIALHWTFDLTYQGQLGHCGFEHRRLAVAFDNADSESRFCSLWTDLYGHPPEFTDEPAG